MTETQTGNGETPIVAQGGDGGRGGRGGAGGQGGTGRNGMDGDPGSPGEPGERGSLGVRFLNGNAFSLITSLCAVAGVIAGAISVVVWVVDLKGDINTRIITVKGDLTTEIRALRIDLTNLDDNIKNLNTPLSQRVFSVEARINEIGRIQQEVRARIESIDTNGTTQNKILKRDVDVMRTEISGQNIRCQEAVRRIDEVQRITIENTLRIQNIIEVLVPHDLQRRK